MVEKKQGRLESVPQTERLEQIEMLDACACQS